MLDTEAFAEFRKALGYLRDGSPDDALPHIRRATELEEHNPFYRSYLGVTLARSEKKWAEAEMLCDKALRMKRDQPQLYLNLAEVYVASGRRQDALETLYMGIRYAQRDRRLGEMLSTLSTRRPPVFTFLDRHHFLNRNIGMWRHRIFKLLENGSNTTATEGVR
jgi:Flp pilus assembly protein TadD